MVYTIVHDLIYSGNTSFVECLFWPTQFIEDFKPECHYQLCGSKMVEKVAVFHEVKTTAWWKSWSVSRKFQFSSGIYFQQNTYNIDNTKYTPKKESE